HITLGTFLAFSSYLVQLTAPARMFAGLVAVGQQARAGAERIFELLESNPVVTESPDAHPLPSVRGQVEFDDVRFGYMRSEPVLDGLTLPVHPGDVVALGGPAGYDTVVGERGLTLSGGQRQRVALARALLTDPHVLILDDATSSVDARVEEEIHATLRRLLQGRTTLLIAHRRSTLRLADRIAVVDGGRVADIGTHEELMARSVLYRRLLAGPGDDCEGEEVPDDGLVAAGTITASAWTPVEGNGNGQAPAAGLNVAAQA